MAVVLRRLAIVFVILSVAAACGGPDAEPVATEAVGGDVFSGTIEGVDGTDIELAAFAETDAIVWFWAPW